MSLGQSLLVEEPIDVIDEMLEGEPVLRDLAIAVPCKIDGVTTNVQLKHMQFNHTPKGTVEQEDGRVHLLGRN